MAAEVRADELAVPRPLVFRVGGRVDAGKSATAAHVALERALLGTVEHIAGREQEDHRVVAREPCVGEHAAVLGRIHRDPVRRAELAHRAEGQPGIESCRNAAVFVNASTRSRGCVARRGGRGGRHE